MARLSPRSPGGERSPPPDENRTAPPREPTVGCELPDVPVDWDYSNWLTLVLGQRLKAEKERRQSVRFPMNSGLHRPRALQPHPSTPCLSNLENPGDQSIDEGDHLIDRALEVRSAQGLSRRTQPDDTTGPDSACQQISSVTVDELRTPASIPSELNSDSAPVDIATDISVSHEAEQDPVGPSFFTSTPHPGPVSTILPYDNIEVETVISESLQQSMGGPDFAGIPWPPQFSLADGSTAPEAPLASPYLNTLQLMQTTIVSACQFNAACLGYDIGRLYEPSCMSRFFRPTSSIDDPAALLAATTHPSIPLHLRPTLPQILFPHHACFDLIPLPTLRSRALMMAAAMPHAFDMMELKRDLYCHNAVVFWRQGTDGRGSQPWDTQNWEVAEWFLRKWSLMLGVEDGELWRSNREWRRARGVESSVLL